MSTLSSFLLIFIIHVFVCSAKNNDFELELVQVLFRHGDRIPSEQETYDNDPYKKYYEAQGYGQLTKIGMKREYIIGKMLRIKYDDFLGDYNVKDLLAHSTDTDRTKMSLELLLAGLYPPTTKTAWSDHIYWFPKCTQYKSIPEDFLYIDLYGACSELVILFSEVKNSPEVQKQLEKYKEFFEYIQKETGIDGVNLIPVFLLYNSIKSALSMGLPLPEWCSKQDWLKIQKIASIVFDVAVFTKTMKKITVGPTVKQLLENINGNTYKNNTRKLYLYSAHDINIATFTRAHEFVNCPDLPDYGSALIFEKLRGKDNNIYIRTLYWTGVSEQLLPLKLKRCKTECLLSDYENIVSSLLPSDKFKKCSTADELRENA